MALGCLDRVSLAQEMPYTARLRRRFDNHQPPGSTAFAAGAGLAGACRSLRFGSGPGSLAFSGWFVPHTGQAPFVPGVPVAV